MLCVVPRVLVFEFCVHYVLVVSKLHFIIFLLQCGCGAMLSSYV